MKNTELLNIKNEFAITTEILEEIKKPFFPLADEFLQELPKIEEILEIAKDENAITPELEKKAKRVKLDIAKIRTSTGKVKDNEKKEVLQRWNAIQACHNVIVKFIWEKEELLEKIIKFSENKEKERIANLQKEREEKIKPFITEVSDLINLWEMEDDRFEAYFLWKKTAFEENQKELKRLEDERIENEKKEKLLYERKLEVAPYNQYMIWELSFNLTINSTEKEFNDFLNSLIEAKKQDDIAKEIAMQARIKREQEEQVEKDKQKAEQKRLDDLAKAEQEKQDEIARIKREQEEKEKAILEQIRLDKEKVEQEKRDKEQLEKRNEYKKFRESFGYNELLKNDFIEKKEDWKIILFKKVWEFNI